MGLRSDSPAKSSELGQTFPAFDATIAGNSAKSNLLSCNRLLKSRLSTESSKLGGKFTATGPVVLGTSEIPKLDSNRPPRLAGVANHPSAKSTKLETFPAPDSKETGGINYARKCLTYGTLQRSAIFRDVYASESNELSKELTSEVGVMGVRDESRFRKSQRLEGYVRQDMSSRVTSQDVGTHGLSTSFLYKSNNLQGVERFASQNNIESDISGVGLVHNYGEVETKDASILTRDQLQSRESHTQLRGTDEIHHVTGKTSAAETSTVFMSKLPKVVTTFVNEVMKSRKGVSNAASLCYPTTNKRGVSFQGSLLMREDAPSKLVAREHEETIANSGKSKLSPFTKRMYPASHTFTSFTNPEMINNAAVIPSKEHDNISASYIRRRTTECSLPKFSQPVKFSYIGTSIDKSAIASGTKRKRSTEKSIDRHVCIPSQSPFNQQNCGEPDQALTKPSLLRNSTDSRLSEKSSQTDLILQKDAIVQTDGSGCVRSAIEKLVGLFEKQEGEIQEVLRQANVIRDETIKILKMFGNEEEDKINNDGTGRENHVPDGSLARTYNDPDISSRSSISATPLRRSARIAAQMPGAVDAETRSVPATPTRFEPDEGVDRPSAGSRSRCSAVKPSKSTSVYRDLRSSFRFLKTPQSTRCSRARTPKNTPTQILSRRLQDQISSLYN